MNVYIATDDSGYSCSLIGIFDTKEKAERARLEYITKYDRQKYLDTSLEDYVNTATANLKRGFYRDDSLTKERLALSNADRALWWLECHFHIREIEMNIVVNKLLYAE